MRITVIVWCSNFLGAWLATAGTRYVVLQSPWAILMEAVIGLNWWFSVHYCKDWKDYKKLVPLMISAAILGVSLGIWFP